MSFKKRMKKISVVALLALTAVPVCGQDLLARQAPVDHRMKALDTLAVSHYRLMEDRENPAADLYEDFSNKYAHKATTEIFFILFLKLILLFLFSFLGPCQ